ncbi:mercuric transporter MerT family protein [Pelagibius sp. CAU 1746]|uniref:mercuric transporter MerT family protein n=1 Tax=Pelagibius sp. CAU 1746 TaxID=3140370 RepID=UPI00325B981C
MSEKQAAAALPETPDTAPDHRPGWFAAGGVVGAALASACCILPLALLFLGVSGAWIGNLTALQPFKPYFAIVALVFVGLGFRQVYFRTAPDCAAGTRCVRPRSSVIVKSALWIATLLVASALTVNWWAPLFY